MSILRMSLCSVLFLISSIPATSTAYAAAGTCTSSVKQFSPGTAISDVTPNSIYEGSAVTLHLTGQNLDKTWVVLLCPATAGATAKPVADSIDVTKASTTAVQLPLYVLAGTAGTYSVYVSDGSGNVYDAKQTVVINPTDDLHYTPCAGPSGSAPVNVNLTCSFTPMPYRMALDNFGKAVANQFVAVELNIQNKNQGLEYLLQDIRGGFPEYVVSTYDKQVPRNVSVKNEQFSARAIIIRVAAAGATVVTGVAGFAGSAVFQQAANIFAGPAQTGLANAIPSLSSTEITNLDSLGYSVNTTVIAKGSQITVVAFLPSEIVGPATSQTGKSHPLKTPNSYSTYHGDELKNLLKRMQVSITGTHVQQVTPSPMPTLSLIITPTTALADLTAAATLTIQGSGLDSVKQVILTGGTPSTTIKASLMALPNSKTTAVDPNVANLVIAKTPGASAGTYKISFVLADGKSVDTGQTVTITNATPLPVAVTPIFSIGAGAVASGTPVLITSTTPGAKIYCTTNGTPPDPTGSPCALPLTVTAAETINAVAAADGFAPSAVGTAKYTIAP